MFTIIDIAYTGGNYRHDSIVELAMIQHNGKQICDEWYSPIKPARELSDFMLAMLHLPRPQLDKAPAFADIAPYIADFCADTTLVGLNIRFAYALLLQGFKACQLPFKRPQICLSKLITQQFGALPAMTLSGACAHYDIPFRTDIALLPRTRLITALFEQLYISQQSSMDKQSVRKTSKIVKYPAQIPLDKIDNLPNAVGVYYFSGKRGQMLYLGKSNDIKKRVSTHFADDIHSIEKLKLKNEICDIQYRLTGSELVALLLESDEIKRYMPTYNRAQRRKTYTHGIYMRPDDKGYHCLHIKLIQPPPDEPITRFSSHWQAVNFIWFAIVRYGLSPQRCDIANYEKWLLHLENNNEQASHTETNGDMSNNTPNALATQQEDMQTDTALPTEQASSNPVQLLPETRREAIENLIFEAMLLPSETYNARIAELMQHYSYPYPNMLIIDKGRNVSERATICIENNQYKGYAYLPQADADKPEKVRDYLIPMRENPDVQSIIRGYLRRYAQQLQVVVY